MAKFPFFKEPIFVWLAIFAGISVKAANAFSFEKPNSTAFLKLDKKSFEFFKSAVVNAKLILFSASIFGLYGA